MKPDRMPSHRLSEVRSARPIYLVKSAASWAIRFSIGLVRPVLSQATRKKIVAWIEKKRLPGRFQITTELLRDFQRSDPIAFHRYLWSNHFAYAASYEIAQQFGNANLDPTRHTLFADIDAQLRARGLIPDLDVRSIFDVGCSLGYVLRYAEENLYHSAMILHGLDIDQYAVERGSAYLRSLGSKIQLTTADMADTDRIMGDQKYDVILCCGVLMYLDECSATQVIKAMLSHANYLVGIICLAHPEIDNAALDHSEVRPSDGALAHNLDRMIRSSGGKVVLHRWGGIQTRGKSPAYTILAEPYQR